MPLDVPRMLACCAAFGDVDGAQERKLSLEALSRRLQSRDRMRSAHTLIDTYTQTTATTHTSIRCLYACLCVYVSLNTMIHIRARARSLSLTHTDSYLYIIETTHMSLDWVYLYA
jgi:hypothetical protein